MPLAVETAFCDSSAVAIVETPGKKRKRNAETNPFLNFTEQTFSIPSSTPIHNRQIDGGAFENPSFRVGNKENYNIFSDSCMEVKSIADLAGPVAAKRTPIKTCDSTNPFEVIRKPPKKKKKQQHPTAAALQDSCFENPGLNLAAVDKEPVNPFEVPRDGDESKRKEAAELSRCFVNSALNIRGPEASGERYNPFEIVRPKELAPEPTVRGLPLPELAGIENPALDMPTYAIAVPFTPSLKHRINFQGLPAGALTPCQMLANMVVCSPEATAAMQVAASSGGSGDTPRRNTTVTLSKRRSLSVISEESDIGEKLDCYQLELENSMNEAKARKQLLGDTTPFSLHGTGHQRRSVRRSLIDMKHISNLSQKLRDLEDEENGITMLNNDECDQHEDEEDKENIQPPPQVEGAVVPTEGKEEKKTESANVADEHSRSTEAYRNQMTFTITKETTVREEIRIDVSNPDVQFEEVEDFEDEEQDVELLHNPAPFQRAYRKKEPLAIQPILPASKDVFKCPPAQSEARESGKSHKVRDVIRRSFRRLIPRHTSEPEQQEKEKSKDEQHPDDQGHHGHGLISSIRHSLRRRQSKACTTGEAKDGVKENKPSGATEDSPLEMSIIAEQPRTVFRQPSLDQYKPVAGAPSGGATLRSSLRRSTKDIRKQMMKSVFRKQSGDLAADRIEHGGQLI